MNGQPALMSGLSISGEQRRTIEAWAAEYRRLLSPGPGEEPAIAVILAKLLAAFPASAQSDIPVAQRMDAYFEALGDVPAWAADRARSDVISGRVPELNRTWAPSPAQFASVARVVLERERGVLRDLERILSAKPIADIDPSERERVSEGFDRLKVDILSRLTDAKAEAA